MIRRLTLVSCLVAGVSLAEEPATPPGTSPDVATVERERTIFEQLTERLIGSASRAVRFDWRQKTVGLGVVGSALLELNSFGSGRFGAFARIPYGDFVVEFALNRAFTWESESTRKLAQTPYRQAGRPGRFELDFNVDYVLAEGVVTPRPSFIPPAQLVFSVTAGLRYIIYTESWRDLTAGQVALAIVSPRLQDPEIANLEIARLPGMEVDRTRYNVLLGVTLDIYFQPGLFISPRAMIAVPIFASTTSSGLGAWWELSARLGWML